MKRLIVIALTALMTLTLAGCAEPGVVPGTAAPSPTPAPAPSRTPQPDPVPESTPPAQPGTPLKIVCTVFPPYDWTRQILGDKAEAMELILLTDGRIDLHSYQPSAADIAAISTCDLFIYIGGESDGWVEDVLRQAARPDRVTINLLEALGEAAKREDELEGPEDGHHHHGDEPDEYGYDEHIWLSLKNAEILSGLIAGALASLDESHAAEYRSHLETYTEQLAALDAEYRAAVSAAPVKTLLFADRFPFRYLMDDYDLRYYAAFSGCSAETEASFETLGFLVEKVNELELNAVMVTESADQSIARTVAGSAKARNPQIFVLDSLQSVTARDADGGMTYLSVMESNLDVLREALR
ncbi:MAG: zinc ABC transporter substrate-binding protein [Oscillospiraceae bacterium]|nr:zinc ABC transporter substrate-binding protein [Oscillospiraceae bacterium]